MTETPRQLTEQQLDSYAELAITADHDGIKVEPVRRLEDGSTHTVQALTEAGESCVQQECQAAREEKKLRQEQYTLRAAIEGVLDEVGYMVDDERVTGEVGGELRQLLRDVLGLDRQLS